MVNEFDKEIDAMLRDLAKGDTFAQILPDLHLDADEISAFAENALPKKARLRTMEHLADCSNCRKILANTFLLNSEDQSEIIHEEAKTVATIPATPWYKKLFAFPQLAYTTGAMALLLVGMVGLLVLQSSRNSEPMMAQKERAADKPYNTGGASSEGEAPLNESYSANSTANAPSTTANSASIPSNSSAAIPESKDAVPMSPTGSSNSNISTLKTAEEDSLADKIKDNDDSLVATKSAEQPTDLAKKEEAKPVATPANEVAETVERRDMNKQSEVSQNRAENQQNISPDSKNVARQQTVSPAPSASGASREGEKNETPKAKKVGKSDEDRKDSSNGTRNIGGKTFRNANGVWTDSSYTGGATKSVKRGSDDYKKLDSGLQNIGNSLSGTVIVVWGGKNYKIQ